MTSNKTQINDSNKDKKDRPGSLLDQVAGDGSKKVDLRQAQNHKKTSNIPGKRNNYYVV